MAVGAVVLNRIKHPSFPNTLSGVIYQSGAFTCITDGQFNQPVAESAYRAARDLDAGERTTLRLANALYRSGDPAGSGAAILALRNRQPSSLAAERLAGHLAMDLRHWDQAIAHFERVR